MRFLHYRASVKMIGSNFGMKIDTEDVFDDDS